MGTTSLAYASPNLRSALLPSGLALLGVVELVSTRPSAWPAALVVELVACLLLGLRTRWPLHAPTAASVTVLALPWFGPQLDDVTQPMVLAIAASYALARGNRGRRGLNGLAVIAGMAGLDYWLVDSRPHGIGDVLFVGGVLLPPYVLGRLTRRLAEQAAALARQQEELARAAVSAERERIARELHDVIAHSLSTMVVQSAAAQEVVRGDPERAAALLAGIADVGRRALSETGRALHLLRDTDDELGLAPAPGLGQVDDLVQAFRASGLQVDVEIDRPLPPRSAGTDLSAYRIVEESLTNALKHSPDRRVSLRISARGAGLQVLASNAASGVSGPGSGLGLVGMAERAELVGGHLSSGRTSDGRYELLATLPL